VLGNCQPTLAGLVIDCSLNILIIGRNVGSNDVFQNEINLWNTSWVLNTDMLCTALVDLKVGQSQIQNKDLTSPPQTWSHKRLAMFVA
jgi:hypothetical protein